MKFYKKKSFIFSILIIVLLYTVLNSLNLNEASLKFVSTYSNEIEAFIKNSFLLSLLVYFAIYIVLSSIGLPVGAILAILSGYFYTLSVGVVITVVSAVFASIFIFYLGKSFLYKYLHKRYGKKVKKIEKAVNKNGAYYVLAIRVSSVLPFFWVNLFFGAANLSYKQYIIPTFIGLIPGTIVYVNMGVSLSSLNSIDDIFSFKIALSFILLGFLVLLPVLVKKLYIHRSN
ncbi:MAG: TVP38/TMEM64 family protein [Campylobacterota bacterium]